MKIKKLVIWFIIMLLGGFVVNSVYANLEWENAVNFMKNEKLSSTANSVEEYVPLSTVKREAAAKFFVNFTEKKFGLQADTTKDCSFIDINQAQDWAKKYIIKACQMGIIKGSNGYFMPKATLTKLQFLTILARIVKKDSKLEPASAFAILKAEGITKASSLTETVKPVSRIELAILFQRAVKKYTKESDDNIENVINSITDENKDNLSKLEITGKVCEKENNVNGNECEGNYVWGAAMNFAWNELKNNILHEDIKLDTKDSKALELARKFNKSIVSKNVLDSKSYYVKSGYGQQTVDLINKESKEKFPNKSFKDLNIILEPQDIISYAYFNKEVEYKKPFTRDEVEFKGNNYKGFKAGNDEERKNIKILNYVNDDKFIIKFNLKDNSDELILAKGYDMKSPENVIKDINKYNKENLSTLEYNDTYHDFFQAPDLHLNYHRNYNTLIGKKLLNQVLVKKCRENNLPDNCYKIGIMFENIKFNMSEKGAKVENEAVIALLLGNAYPNGNEQATYKERHFYLNKDYWVVMKRSDKKIPYFVLGVTNGNLMVKNK